MPYISKRKVGNPNKIEQKEAVNRHNNSKPIKRLQNRNESKRTYQCYYNFFSSTRQRIFGISD